MRAITDSRDDQLLLQIQGAMAEYERAKIPGGGAFTAPAWVSCPPAGSLRYRRNARRYGGDGKIRIDKQGAAMVRQAWAWYAETQLESVRRPSQAQWLGVEDDAQGQGCVGAEHGATHAVSHAVSLSPERTG